jgi:hypothetical protein
MLKRQQRAKLYKNGRKKKDNKDCKEKQNICCQEITTTHETEAAFLCYPALLERGVHKDV